MSGRTKLIALGVLLVVAICAGSYYAGYDVAKNKFVALYAQFAPIKENDPSLPLVSPILGFRAPEATTLGYYTSLNTDLQNEISTVTKSGDASRVAVYFRDLNNLEWVGINQNDNYYPASLLKVPVMFAYYKEAQANPDLLTQTFVYPGVTGGDPFDAPSDLVVGQSYTVNELIDRMIIDSDNGATFTLLAQMNPTILHQVYLDIGIPDPGTDSASYQISAHIYGLFFRILYNATYLSPYYSEKALELLSKATFTDGLVAGVPSKTKVAHKFGEHVLSTDGKTATGVELSDCGIVYYPSHPYLLCVMTSAKDIWTATNIIKSMSATTYSAVKQEYLATSTAAQ